MSTRRIVAEWLRDSMIALALIVAGVTAMEVLAIYFGWQSRLLRTICECVSFVPFLWFAKRKGVMDFDLVDVVVWLAFGALLAFVLSYPSVTGWLHEHERCSAILFPVTVLGSIYVYRNIRNFCAFRFHGNRPHS